MKEVLRLICLRFFHCFRHGTSTITNAVSLVGPSQVYLSHCAPTFIYNTSAVTQSVARFVCDNWDLFQLGLYTDHEFTEVIKSASAVIIRPHRSNSWMRPIATEGVATETE